MSIWAANTVSEEPEVMLSDWRIFEVPGGNRHFVGRNLTGGSEGRVSSAIQVFDKNTMLGVTRSGRVYQLVGDPGFCSDAAYTWGHWCAVNDIKDCEDVSSEVSIADSANPLDVPPLSMEAALQNPDIVNMVRKVNDDF